MKQGDKDFSLLIEQIPQSPNVRVGWRLSEVFHQILRDGRVLHPYVFLMALRPNEDVFEVAERYLVPFKRGEQLIQFDSPGENRVVGCLVWLPEEPSKRKVWRTLSYLLRLDEYDVFDEMNFLASRAHQLISKRSESYLQSDVDDVSVDVPDEFFTESPKDAWWYWWANWCHQKEAKTPCEVRKRLIFGTLPKLLLASLIGIFVAIEFIISVVAGLLYLLFGMRLQHIPEAATEWDYPFDAPDQWFWNRMKKVGVGYTATYEYRSRWTQLVMTPMLWVAITGLSLVIVSLTDFDVKANFDMNANPSWFSFAMVVVIAFCLSISGIVISSLIDYVSRKWNKIREERKKRDVDGLADMYFDATKPLAASPEERQSMPYEPQELRHRVVLRFQRWQGRVCKPYAKR